jgi:hypothetical protein
VSDVELAVIAGSQAAAGGSGAAVRSALKDWLGSKPEAANRVHVVPRYEVS